MRETKYRAWDIQRKIMILWEDIKRGFLLEELFDSEFFIVMQYINLEDKIKKEIYEGDVFEEDVFEEEGMHPSRYVVAFNKDRVGYFPFAKGDGCGCCEGEVLYDSTYGSVIGNIYENPELVEDINENE